MPEANYLLSVSWGYIKVRLEVLFGGVELLLYHFIKEKVDVWVTSTSIRYYSKYVFLLKPFNTHTNTNYYTCCDN